MIPLTDEDAGELETALFVKEEPDGEIVATSIDKQRWTGYVPSDEAEVKELVRRKDAVSHAHKWHDKGVEKERGRIRDLIEDYIDRIEKEIKRIEEEGGNTEVAKKHHELQKETLQDLRSELDSNEGGTAD